MLIKKTIRSFVRREGRITKKQQQAMDELFPKYGLEIEDGALDLSAVFGRNAETSLEIGFGMGDTLWALAKENPQKNYLGIEVYRPGVGSLLAKIAENNLTNIRVYCADAVEVLQQCIANNSLTEILILFPDPWQKKRHHKRRILQTDFIWLLYSKLKTGGYLHIATDWENYAEHIKELMIDFAEFETAETKSRPLTKFEQRGKKLGHKIWDFGFIKK